MIELLVVVAIIAILAGLLLPALARAKTRATAVHCTSSLRQLQVACQMYVGDNKDYLPGNNWQQEAGSGASRGSLNWVTGWLDPRQPGNADNTNVDLLLNPQWSQIGPYAGSAGIYHCMASRVVCREGSLLLPVVRTVSMNGWMGVNNSVWNDGFQSYHKQTEFLTLSPSDANIFIDERDDSIDDGYFAVDMQTAQIVNYPANYHGGSGGASFADGHAEIHKWRSPELQPPQQMSVQVSKQQFTSVSARNVDLAWLRYHSTRPAL